MVENVFPMILDGPQGSLPIRVVFFLFKSGHRQALKCQYLILLSNRIYIDCLAV